MSAGVARSLLFTVRGLPAAQGSKRHVGGGVMIESSKKVKPWRSDVKAAAEEAMDSWDPALGPVEISIAFLFNRPKSVNPAKRPYMTVAPDLDKTIRSTLDALTAAGVWKDDSQVVRVTAWKRYAEPHEYQGAQIHVMEIK
jgi:crossover junction endodeoxyribonuclease RusA